MQPKLVCESRLAPALIQILPLHRSHPVSSRNLTLYQTKRTDVSVAL